MEFIIQSYFTPMENNLPTVEKIELRHGNYYQIVQQSSGMALMMRP